MRRCTPAADDHWPQTGAAKPARRVRLAAGLIARSIDGPAPSAQLCRRLPAPISVCPSRADHRRGAANMRRLREQGKVRLWASPPTRCTSCAMWPAVRSTISPAGTTCWIRHGYGAGAPVPGGIGLINASPLHMRVLSDRGAPAAPRRSACAGGRQAAALARKRAAIAGGHALCPRYGGVATWWA